MTTQFVSAAALMARVLGCPGYPSIVIDHPISSASDAALLASADSTIGQLKRLLLTSA
jgi:hypothetical protein